MMINLQENLDKQGIRTTPKGVCDVCQKPIVGQVVTALGMIPTRDAVGDYNIW